MFLDSCPISPLILALVGIKVRIVQDATGGAVTRKIRKEQEYQIDGYLRLLHDWNPTLLPALLDPEPFWLDLLLSMLIVVAQVEPPLFYGIAANTLNIFLEEDKPSLTFCIPIILRGSLIPSTVSWKKIWMLLQETCLPTRDTTRLQ